MYNKKNIHNYTWPIPTLDVEWDLRNINISNLVEAFENGKYGGLNIFKSKSMKPMIFNMDFVASISNLKLFGIYELYVSDLAPLLMFQHDLEILSLDISKCQNPQLLNVFSNIKGLNLSCKLGWKKGPIIIPNADELNCGENADLRMFDFKGAFKLFSISLNNNPKNVDISNIGAAPNVRILEHSFMHNLSDFNFISSMHTLIYISFVWVPKLETIPDISRLKQLKIISVDTCNRLNNLSAIVDNHSIETLIINSTVSNIEIIRPLVDHPSLRYICISFKSEKLRVQAKALLGDRLKNFIQELPVYTIGSEDLLVEYR